MRQYVELVHISDLRLICLVFDLSKWESKRARNWLLLVKALAGMAYIRDQSIRPPCPLHFLFNSLIKATKMPQNLVRIENGTQILPSLKSRMKAAYKDQNAPFLLFYPRMFFFGGYTYIPPFYPRAQLPFISPR